VCDRVSDGTTRTWAYNDADRVADTGYVYDPFGRTSAVPAADASGSATVTATYFANDLVRSLSQSGVTKTWDLDPNFRLHRWTTSTTGLQATNHYSDDSDSPNWIDEGSGAWSRNIEGISGELAAIQSSTAGTYLQLANLHGDIVATATVTGGSGPTATFESTEFGAPRTTSPRRYGWLGAKQRPADTVAGVVLMGVRLYLPTIGRFLQVDPVPGGSANAYDYVNADPINNFDLDGRFCGPVCRAKRAASGWEGLQKATHRLATGLAISSAVLSWAPGTPGALATAATGIWSSNLYKLSGDSSAGNRMLVVTAVNAASSLVGAKEQGLLVTRGRRIISHIGRSTLTTDISKTLCGNPWATCSRRR
jgi:RHS repeat-associated protein